MMVCCAAGCGKTTLLSVLAGSVSSLSANSQVYGQVSLDGQPRRSWASRLVAYVPQFDFLLPTLTVAETLRYSAQLRLPRAATAAEVKVRAAPSHLPSLLGAVTLHVAEVLLLLARMMERLVSLTPLQSTCPQVNPAACAKTLHKSLHGRVAACME